MPQPTDKNAVWLNTTETVLLVGSVGTSVASVILQQVTFAAITSVQLSLVLGLNSLNRKRLDDLNQQNQNAIAQIQQQFLKEQSSIRQIDKATQQLTTHQDIPTLQQQIEQVKDSFQRQLSSLSEAVEDKRNLLSCLNEELTSLKESISALSLEEIELFKDKVDNLASQLETTLQQVEAQAEQSVHQAESRLSDKNEPFLLQMSMLRSQYDQLKAIASEQKQIPQKALQELSTQVAELLFLRDFNPEDIRNSIQILLEEVGRLDASIQQILVSENQPIQSIESENLSQSHQYLRNAIQKAEIEAAKAVNMFRHLDTRLKKLEKEPTSITTCDWCGTTSGSIFLGGFVNNQNFCSKECEKMSMKRIDQQEI